jgi:hypothetical protein
LYEMLCQFKSTGILRLSVLELKERFQLVNTEGVEQYTRWSNFEKNVLQAAQNEINEKADFKFDYKLKKNGRKIVSVEFVFRKPEPPPTIVHTTAESVSIKASPPPLDAKHERMLERLRAYGLVTEQLNRIVAKHTPTVINKTLYDLDCNKEGIKNTAAYLLKIFEG